MTQRAAFPKGLLLLVLLCAMSFGAIVRVALATDNTHVTCVSHGFVGGSSDTDGSFFSRIDAGCGSTYRECGIYTWGSFIGSQAVFDSSSLCSAWSRDFGNFSECASSARLTDPAAFSAHNHNAPNWCG